MLSQGPSQELLQSLLTHSAQLSRCALCALLNTLHYETPCSVAYSSAKSYSNTLSYCGSLSQTEI